MEYIYSEIKLNSEFKDYVDENEKTLESISGLSSINILVGSNNSGKSRFLREIIKIKELEFRVKDIDLKEINQKLDELQKGLIAIGSANNNIATFSIPNHQSTGIDPQGIPQLSWSSDYFSHTYFDKKKIKESLDFLKNLAISNFTLGSYRGHHDINKYQNEIKNYIQSNNQHIEDIRKSVFEEIKFKKFYIPTLRTLNYFGGSDGYSPSGIKDTDTNDFYKKRVLSTYALNEDNMNLEVFTGLALYKKVRSMLLGDSPERKRITEYQAFLKEELFEGQEVLLIPKETDDVLHIKIGDEERPIYQLGDGIQSLIILTFPLFEVDNGIFFIEEPEIHLHPRLQRKYISLLNKMKKHQFFITTHSNHLLDLTLDYTDISIYTFNRNSEKKTIVNQVSDADENILQLLGAKNSSVFLSNSTIWVEGITDRLYIRKYLELYQKDKNIKIQEDTDYSFVEYGGNNITHWSFLDNEEYPINIERLCAKSFLITDDDGDKKMDRKDLLKSNLGDRYALLPCKEIENSLSLKTIERVLRQYEGEQFQIPSTTKNTAHLKTGLGKFIEEKLFTGSTMKRKGGYKADSGTIKDKVNFCKKAVNDLTVEELSPVAIDLAEKIYNFVLSQKD